MLMPAAATTAGDIVGYALVQEDATLQVRGRKVHLYGIFIPPTERQCRTFLRPVRCASRAALALDFKIRGFVHCEPKLRNQDRSIVATCWVNRTYHAPGEDLSAYLLEQGWAVPLPDAPFAYQVLGELSREKRRGVWGFQADAIR
jgi:endonuclease YncB( thermonuclease family)